MKTMNRPIGEHVATILATKEEVRFAYSREGVTILITSVEGDITTQLLPDNPFAKDFANEFDAYEALFHFVELLRTEGKCLHCGAPSETLCDKCESAFEISREISLMKDDPYSIRLNAKLDKELDERRAKYNYRPMGVRRVLR